MPCCWPTPLPACHAPAPPSAQNARCTTLDALHSTPRLATLASRSALGAACRGTQAAHRIGHPTPTHHPTHPTPPCCSIEEARQARLAGADSLLVKWELVQQYAPDRLGLLLEQLRDATSGDD